MGVEMAGVRVSKLSRQNSVDELIGSYQPNSKSSTKQKLTLVMWKHNLYPLNDGTFCLEYHRVACLGQSYADKIRMSMKIEIFHFKDLRL